MSARGHAGRYSAGRFAAPAEDDAAPQGDPHRCAAYGCTLPGTMRVEGRDWCCRFHAAAEASAHDAVTFRLRKHRRLVGYIEALRRVQTANTPDGLMRAVTTAPAAVGGFELRWLLYGVQGVEETAIGADEGHAGYVMRLERLAMRLAVGDLWAPRKAPEGRPALPERTAAPVSIAQLMPRWVHGDDE